MLHLAPDGVRPFLPARGLSFDAGTGAFARDRLANFFNESLIALAHVGELFGQRLVGSGMQPAKGVIL